MRNRQYAWLRFVSIILTAITMSAGFAHLLELPNKINLSPADYLTVQQIYRGWALLGVAVIGALLSTATLAVLIRRTRTGFYRTLGAALCLAASLAIFFAFTYPANQQTLNGTMLPDNWEQLRRRWEYSHAVNAGLYFLALMLLTGSLLESSDERR